ncbi:hypothetical protein A8V01_04465 [Novosphingobium guangzhouense]|uniref:Glycosyl transferase family 1 n=2 Tax=Novosphingobium guangzhouense TaxID=1850347 RepID=A0A2K2G259_9SPHN|nr:hypothetical protein A8V01_04465 [Novosphingobium guangzhouense]
MTTVCIDCRYLGARPSGIGEVVRGLIDHLPSMAPDLRFLLLRNPAHSGPLSTSSNVEERAAPQAANGPATMWWLSKVVRMDDVDLFHAPSNIMPAGLGMPCVTTVHDVMWLTHPQWCRTGLRGAVERGFYRHGIGRALRSAAVIATVSKATADAIAAIMPQAAARTTVTLSGVSSRFHPVTPAEQTLKALGINPKRRFVLTVGQYAPYKNHEGVVRAFALAFGDRSDVDLVMVQRMGDGARKLLNIADSLGLNGRVILLSTVPEQALVELYSAALALLHPSLCEGFGNPLAEAMACGCPVVTSDISAMPEVVGGSARLANPYDYQEIAAQLKAVIEAPAETARLREKGLQRAAQLTWRAFAAANLAIYRRVLNGDTTAPKRTTARLERAMDTSSTPFSITAS